MDFESIAIGTDIENISRFKNKTPDTDLKFLNRIFTESELRYSFSHGLPEQHLCARYCAKEAIVKALSEYNITDVYYGDIEVFNKETGKPCAQIPKHPEIEIKLSISHTKDIAMCTAVCNKKVV